MTIHLLFLVMSLKPIPTLDIRTHSKVSKRDEYADEYEYVYS